MEHIDEILRTLKLWAHARIGAKSPLTIVVDGEVQRWEPLPLKGKDWWRQSFRNWERDVDVERAHEAIERAEAIIVTQEKENEADGVSAEGTLVLEPDGFTLLMLGGWPRSGTYAQLVGFRHLDRVRITRIGAPRK